MTAYPAPEGELGFFIIGKALGGAPWPFNHGPGWQVADKETHESFGTGDAPSLATVKLEWTPTNL